MPWSDCTSTLGTPATTDVPPGMGISSRCEGAPHALPFLEHGNGLAQVKVRPQRLRIVIKAVTMRPRLRAHPPLKLVGGGCFLVQASGLRVPSSIRHRCAAHCDAVRVSLIFPALLDLKTPITLLRTGNFINQRFSVDIIERSQYRVDNCFHTVPIVRIKLVGVFFALRKFISELRDDPILVKHGSLISSQLAIVSRPLNRGQPTMRVLQYITSRVQFYAASQTVYIHPYFA